MRNLKKHDDEMLGKVPSMSRLKMLMETLDGQDTQDTLDDQVAIAIDNLAARYNEHNQIPSMRDDWAWIQAQEKFYDAMNKLFVAIEDLEIVIEKHDG
jgi:hypothetical protein